MNREVLDRWCERGIVGLILTILIFGPLAMGAVEMPYFLVIQGLTIGVLMLWCARLWLNPRPQFLWPPICWAVLAFAAYALIRYLTADLEYIARIEMVRVLIYACLFLAIVNNLYRQEQMQLVVLVLVFLAMTISFYAVFQFITGSDKVWVFTKPYAHRGSGTYISPNHLAGFLEMILPLALAWTLVSRARPLTKVFVGYAALAILAGIVVSVSRGGWVATGLMLFVFFGQLAFHRTYRLPALVLLTVLVGAAVYFIPRTHFLQSRLKEINANDQFNDSARFLLWGPALQLWRENIWWGIGPNHYNSRFRAVRPEAEQFQPDRVHNDYLNTLTDWGIAGTALVAGVWALLLAGVLKTWQVVRGTPGDLGGRSSNRFALVLGGALGLLAILFHSVVDFNMHIPANAILAVSLMALLSACLRFATDRFWFDARRAGRVLMTLLLLAGAVYLGAQGFRAAREQFWLARARQAPIYSPEQAAALERAFAIEPHNHQTAFAIGKALRAQCWNNGDVDLAKRALEWFKRSMDLNPFDGYGFLEYGICLDWPLERSNEARPYFDQAVRLDPNGYYTVAYMGWHYFQVGDYAAARTWLRRSRRLGPRENPIANSYLELCTRKMLEGAAPGNLRLPSLPAKPGASQ